MSYKQNSNLDKESSSEDDQERREQNDPAPKSYYYDDSTGYEIYKDEGVDDEEAEDAKTAAGLDPLRSEIVRSSAFRRFASSHDRTA
jgi:hypothetical protein